MFNGNSLVVAAAICAGVGPPIAAVLVRFELRIRRLKSLLEVNIQFKRPEKSEQGKMSAVKRKDSGFPSSENNADAAAGSDLRANERSNQADSTLGMAQREVVADEDGTNADAESSGRADGDDGILSNPLVELVKIKYAADLRIPADQEDAVEAKRDTIKELRKLVAAASKPRAFFQSRLILPALFFGLAAAFGFYAFINAVMSDFAQVFSSCTPSACQAKPASQTVLVVGSIVFAGAYIAAMRIVIQAVTSFDLTGYTFVRQGAEVVFSVVLGMLIFKAFPDPMQTFGKIVLSTDTLGELALSEKERKTKGDTEYKACLDDAFASGSPTAKGGAPTENALERCRLKHDLSKSATMDSIPWYWIVLAAVFGLIPTSSSRYLLNKAQGVFRWSKTADERFSGIARITPLDILDGIDFDIRYRLEECGLRDVQNLACANPVMLAIESPFNLNEIIDWVGQAQLCHIVGLERYMLLREYNVRTIFDLERAIDSRDTSETFDVIYGSILLSPTEAMKIAADTTKIKFLIDDGDTVKHVSLEEFTSWAYKKIAFPAAGQDDANKALTREKAMSRAIEHMMYWISDDLHVRRLRRLWQDIEYALGPNSGYFEDSMRRKRSAARLKTTTEAGAASPGS